MDSVDSLDSNQEYMTRLKNELDFDSDVEELNEPQIKKGDREVIDIIEDKLYEQEEIKMSRSKKVTNTKKVTDTKNKTTVKKTKK
jgi:hypothetical protein